MNELFEQLVYDALKEKVSDIHLLSKEKGIIKFRKKGRLYDYDTIDSKRMTKLLNYIRFISKIKQEYIESKINSQFEKELKELGISL